MAEIWIDRVRHWMTASGTSQGSLARALDCTRGAVGHYLAGRRQPTLTQMERIAGVMDVHPAWLLYGLGPPRITEKSAPDRMEQQACLSLRVMEPFATDTGNNPKSILNLNVFAARCYGVSVPPGSGNPRAYEGEILVIDPDAVPQPGDEVLVGFSEGDTAYCELVANQGGLVIIRAMHDQRQLHEFEPGELPFIHRVIAVIRRDALPSGTREEQK